VSRARPPRAQQSGGKGERSRVAAVGIAGVEAGSETAVVHEIVAKRRAQVWRKILILLFDR
jgi:hypothetical protein